MLDQFNVLIEKFRIKVLNFSGSFIRFSIPHWRKEFELGISGEILELVSGQYESTKSSQWIEGVSKGAIRND